MKRSTFWLASAATVMVLEEACAFTMVRAGVMSSLLGAPSLFAGAFAAAFVLLRVLAVVAAPGMIAAAIASLLAERLHLTGSSSGAGISVGAAGATQDRAGSSRPK